VNASLRDGRTVGSQKVALGSRYAKLAFTNPLGWCGGS
jgi:hypothetical protein